MFQNFLCLFLRVMDTKTIVYACKKIQLSYFHFFSLSFWGKRLTFFHDSTFTSLLFVQLKLSRTEVSNLILKLLAWVHVLNPTKPQLSLLKSKINWKRWNQVWLLSCSTVAGHQCGSVCASYWTLFRVKVWKSKFGSCETVRGEVKTNVWPK